MARGGWPVCGVRMSLISITPSGLKLRHGCMGGNRRERHTGLDAVADSRRYLVYLCSMNVSSCSGENYRTRMRPACMWLSAKPLQPALWQVW
jgi:hypothetical protein